MNAKVSMRTLFKLVQVVIYLSGLMVVSVAQEKITLQKLERDQLVQKRWEVSLPVQLNELTFNYAVLADGVATYSRKERALVCYGFDGSLKWKEAHSEYPGAQLAGSPNGIYLSVCYAIGESVPAAFIYNHQGKVLRQADFCTRNFSASSNYLIGGGLKPMVLDAETGRSIWSKVDEQKYWNWKFVSTQNDRLIVYTAGLLEQFDLSTGERIWQKNVSFESEPGATSWLKVTPNGNVIVLQFFILGKIHQKNLVFVYDLHGELLSQRETPVVPGKTNGGIIDAISDDGQYFAVSDLNEFYVCRANSFNRLWTIPHRIVPHEVRYFSKNLLVFKPNSHLRTTQIIILNESGEIQKNYVIDRMLDFQAGAHLAENTKSSRSPGKNRGAEQDYSFIPVLQIEENSGEIRMSMYHFSNGIILE